MVFVKSRLKPIKFNVNWPNVNCVTQNLPSIYSKVYKMIVVASGDKKSRIQVIGK
jgi:hypothetical protein